MSEKELNKNYIKGIILASKGNEELLVNEIQQLCSKEYIKGLRQGKFDATMDAQEERKSLIKYLEEEIKNHKTMNVILDEIHNEIKTIKNCAELLVYQDILERVKSGKYD